MEKETGWNLFTGRDTPSTVELDDSFFRAVPEDSAVLDFGCAWGRVAFQLQKRGYNVTGFDLNESSISTALKTAQLTNMNYNHSVKFQTANAINLPYIDASYDACILQAFLTTIISPEDRIKIISEAHRVLKDDGILYLADFGQNWEDTLYNKRYRRDYPITGELGTFLVRDSKNRYKELFRAHHYTKEELFSLIEGLFTIENVHETTFTTFHGNRTKGYIIIARR